MALLPPLNQGELGFAVPRIGFAAGSTLAFPTSVMIWPRSWMGCSFLGVSLSYLLSNVCCAIRLSVLSGGSMVCRFTDDIISLIFDYYEVLSDLEIATKTSTYVMTHEPEISDKKV